MSRGSMADRTSRNQAPYSSTLTFENRRPLKTLPRLYGGSRISRSTKEAGSKRAQVRQSPQIVPLGGCFSGADGTCTISRSRSLIRSLSPVTSVRFRGARDTLLAREPLVLPCGDIARSVPTLCIIPDRSRQGKPAGNGGGQPRGGRKSHAPGPIASRKQNRRQVVE